MQTQTLTLDDLVNHDPRAPRPHGAQQWRFYCPECGETTGKRNLTLKQADGIYFCHKCGVYGCLGDLAHRSNRPALPARDEYDENLRRYWNSKLPIGETAAERYLMNKRGLMIEIIAGNDLWLLPDFYGRCAVGFPIYDGDHNLVALQGRYTTDSEDVDTKMRTVGHKRNGVFATAGAWDGIVAITEAPIDALSLLQLGIPAIATVGVALPECKLPAWVIHRCKGRTVYLASDADEAGDTAAERWAKQLRGVAVATERLRAPRAKDWNAEICIA